MLLLLFQKVKALRQRPSQVSKTAFMSKCYNKQLLDEVEHDIMSYQNRGLCYRLRQIIQTRGFDNS